MVLTWLNVPPDASVSRWFNVVVILIFGFTKSALRIAVPKSSRISSSGKSWPTNVKFAGLVMKLPAGSVRMGRLTPKKVLEVSTTWAFFREAATPRYVTWKVSLALAT